MDVIDSAHTYLASMGLLTKIGAGVTGGVAIVTHNILPFITGFTIGFLLDAGIKYVARIWKYERRGDAIRRRD